MSVMRQPHTFAVQLEEMLAKVTERTRPTISGSPNNLTGNTVSTSDLVKLLKRRAIVVVDKAFKSLQEARLLI